MYKNKIKIIFLFFFAFYGILYTQNVKQKTQKNIPPKAPKQEWELDYKLVKKIDLGKDVRKIYLGPAEENSAGKPKLAMAYKIDKITKRTRDRLLYFYDDNLNILKKIPFSNLVVSENAEYVGIYTVLEHPTKWKTGRMKFEIFDKYGNKTWVDSGEAYIKYDRGLQRYFLADEGNFVKLIQSDSAFLIFYNKYGIKMKSAKLLDRYKGREITEVKAVFSQNSDYLAVVVTDLTGKSFRKQSAIMLFDKAGSLLWQYEPEEEITYGWVFISSEGSYIVASFSYLELVKGIYTTTKVFTYLFNKHGNLIKKLDFWTILASFSKFEKYVLLSSRNEVLLLETETGIPLFQKEKVGFVYDIDIVESGKTIGIIDERRIKLFDFNGKLLWATTIETHYNSRIKRKLSISRNGEEVVAVWGRELYVYERK